MDEHFDALVKDKAWGNHWSLRGLDCAFDLTLRILRPDGWTAVGGGSRAIKMWYNGSSRYENVQGEVELERVLPPLCSSESGPPMLRR